MKKIRQRIKYLAWRIKIEIEYRVSVIAGRIEYNTLIIGIKFKQRLSKPAPYKSLLILLTLFIAIVLYFLYINWISAPDFWEIAKKKTTTTLEIHSQISRNRGWLTWMVISLSGLAIGIALTTWGRIIQHKSHLNERYEKASSMLGNEVMAVRIAGCLALMSLGKEDKNMKVQCVRLLFSFINDPYLKLEHQDKNLDEIFPEDEPLRLDIQEAVDSFCAIYNHYGNKVIDEKPIRLPSYFWKNQHKYRISFIKANLWKEESQRASLSWVNFQGAYLVWMNLQEAHLGRANFKKANLHSIQLQRANLAYADLQDANLEYASLQGANLTCVNFRRAILRHADITNAKIERAENLTKEQILSARWGFDKEAKGNPPLLPDEIENDAEVQQWLAIPHYNEKEEEEKRQERLKNNS